MLKMICFDMDGTIADLYAVDNWLAKLRAEDETPYQEAKVCLICLLSMNGRSGGHYLPVVISHGGRTIQLTALADTGNTLRDPISGWPVLVTDSWAAEHLLGLTREQLSDPVGFLTECVNPGLRLIPFHSVTSP